MPQERDPPPSQGLPSAPCLWGSSRGAEGAPPPITQVLDNCPNHRLAPAVDAPLLIPEAVELLEKTLHPQEYSTWKMLGIAWNKTRWALGLHHQGGAPSSTPRLETPHFGGRTPTTTFFVLWQGRVPQQRAGAPLHPHLL